VSACVSGGFRRKPVPAPPPYFSSQFLLPTSSLSSIHTNSPLNKAFTRSLAGFVTRRPCVVLKTWMAFSTGAKARPI